MASNISTNT